MWTPEYTTTDCYIHTPELPKTTHTTLRPFSFLQGYPYQNDINVSFRFHGEVYSNPSKSTSGHQVHLIKLEIQH